MSFVGLVIAVLCIVALFCGAIHAIGSVVIALVKYVIAPIAILTIVLAVIKYGF